MRIDNTPPINAVGEYQVAAPFVLEAGRIYKCDAIDGFEVLEERGKDVFALFYETVGLSAAIYEEDRLNGINIITLVSDNAPSVDVPSSYIARFPNQTVVPYSQLILSVDLGLLPDGIDLTSTSDSIASIVSELVGIPESSAAVADVNIHNMSTTNGVDFSEHERLENNRKARIEAGGREAHFVTIRRQAEQIQTLLATNQALMQIIDDLQP